MLEKLKILLNNYDENAEYIGNGYYRLRTLDSSTWELAYLVAGKCGERLVAPKIVCSLLSNTLIGNTLMDMESTPTCFLERSEATAEIIDAELDKLLNQFISAKNLTI